MKKVKKIGGLLLALLGIIILTGGIFVNSLTPTYEGEQLLSRLLKETKVYYDSYGIPHIYAQNDTDAFRVLGYVHAQDRLWQMELMRRIASGRLSEVFGKELLRTDRFFLALGIDDASVKTVEGLDKNSAHMQLSRAYLDGVNQFVKRGPTPIEFYLTGIEKTEFELKDIYNTFGYMAFSFAMAHKTDPLLTNIKNKLGPEYLEDLEIGSNANTLCIKNHRQQVSDSVQNNITAMVKEALEGISLPLFEGSNSWVIAPEKTKNGKVIFANDPHIGFGQPSVWYEAHVSTPTYEKYGYHLAGVPFPILGHDRNLAYGMTMFENDDVDFFYEEPHPSDASKYKYGDRWKSYESITKAIKVKDTSDVSFTYLKTKNGPVLNGIADQIDGERPISMWWAFTQYENKLLGTLYEMAYAGNISDFHKAISNIHAPGLNMMYGDAEGNIAWWATAQLYRMPDSINTKFVFRGSPERELLDFSENPHAVNPPWGYVYSANNQPDSISGMLYPGYYLPENRAKRIVKLLEPKSNWDMKAVSEMITDVTSSVNPEIVANLAKLIEIGELSDDQIQMLNELNAWKGESSLKSIASTFYHRWIYYFLKKTFQDELGDEMFGQFLATHFHKRLIATMAANPKSVWYDDMRTQDTTETQTNIVNKAFLKAFESLQKDFGTETLEWTWDKVHTLEHEHPIGKVAALRSFFNVGPFPVNGTREVINNMYFDYNDTGLYKVRTGPSTRRVIDFSDIENSLSILPTGQSGNPFSPHYNDQAEMYVNGEFRKMMMNKAEIIENSKHLLVFGPSEE